MISNNHSVLWAHLRPKTAAAMSNAAATAMTTACRRELSKDSLIRAPICRVESRASAARSMDVCL
jgi:hypothetical protein